MKKTIVRKVIVLAMVMGAWAALAVSAQDVPAVPPVDQGGVAAQAPAAPAVAAAPAVPKPPAPNLVWGGWGRVIFAPLIVQGGNVFDENGAPKLDSDGVIEVENNAWAGSAPSDNDIGAVVGVYVNGKNPAGTVGMDLLLHVDVGGGVNGHNVIFAKDNTANAWAKPFGNEWLTVRGGLLLIDDLFGKVGGVNENFGFTGSKGGAEDHIFDRVNSGGKFAFHFKSVPITGLQLHATVGVNDSAVGNYNKTDRADAWKEVFSAGQYGIGYTIGTIGFARFQFIGGTYGKSSLAAPMSSTARWEQVQFAFQLKAVKNLNLDMGIKIPFKIEGDSTATVNHQVRIDGTLRNLMDDDVYQAPISGRIAGRYNFGALGLPNLALHLGAKFGFAEKWERKTLDYTYERPFTFGLDFEPSWKLGNVGRIVGNFMVQTKAKSTTTSAGVSTEGIDDTTDMGLGISFHRSLGNGNFSVGIYSQFPVGGEGYSDIANGLAKAQAFKFAIPITITYDL